MVPVGGVKVVPVFSEPQDYESLTRELNAQLNDGYVVETYLMKRIISTCGNYDWPYAIILKKSKSSSERESNVEK